MTQSHSLFDPLSSLRGVGPKTLQALSSLHLETVYDLLYDFPVRYDQLTSVPLDQLVDGQKVLLKGNVVTEPFLSRFGYKKSRLSFKIRIDHDIIMVNFFNQPWLKAKIKIGLETAVYGRFDLPRQQLNAIRLVASQEQDRGLAPIYSANQKITIKKLVKLIDVALEDYGGFIQETVPLKIRQKYRLLPEKTWVVQMHHPKNPRAAELARRSAAFQEFFAFQAQLAQLMQKRTGDQKFAKHYQLSAIKALLAELTFTLSEDQKQVINEIFSDLHSSRQMRRLLQGDVGSGKTIVAVFAIFAVITAGYQAALMVPTEILAQQHFQKITALLAPLGVSVALLTGSTKSVEREKYYQDLANGRINVVIGTQALIQKNVKFKKLGLALIDEQHRFGVRQRQALIDKGKETDFLAMTATPIPRTLALTVYGDMAVSEIHHLPSGRRPIVSRWVNSRQLSDVYKQMKTQLAAGFQIYAVTPLIHESEKSDLKNAVELSQRLTQAFPRYKVVLLHGQLNDDQKETIMSDFRAKKIDLLVTTSVIEVGVDVPNANMMVVFDADRFGLSQLHQLRGRIGRGHTASYCVFVADPTTEIGKKRMKIITQTSDGFKIAEEDLKLRGEGDLFGQAQSGLPNFKIGNVVTDYAMLLTAKKCATQLLEKDPDLTDPDNRFLRTVLEYKQYHNLQ